jgi:predicted flap endonuclease-1-like 5' DNA nuclease
VTAKQLVTIIGNVPKVPVVTGINPATGKPAGGDSITVTGSEFTGATAVNFGTHAASVMKVIGDTQITATSPADAAGGTLDLTVVAPGGTSAISAADQFTHIQTGQLTTLELTRVTGIDEARAERLQAAGVTRLRELAGSQEETIAAMLAGSGITLEMAQQFIDEAKRILEGQWT